MKVVINVCYGGFSLSPLATKKIAELKGKECYFFKFDLGDEEYKPITIEEAEKAYIWYAYSVPNPEDYRLNERDEDGLYKSANERAEKISLCFRDLDRTDKELIKVVEELKNKANGSFAKLKVVTIPDGIKWEIEEYDGNEWISEIHRIWN